MAGSYAHHYATNVAHCSRQMDLLIVPCVCLCLLRTYVNAWLGKSLEVFAVLSTHVLQVVRLL